MKQRSRYGQKLEALLDTVLVVKIIIEYANLHGSVLNKDGVLDVKIYVMVQSLFYRPMVVAEFSVHVAAKDIVSIQMVIKILN